MTLDDIDITNNLIWRDEFAFNQVEQATERTLTGGLIIQHGVKLFGRPITLEGWLSRETLDALYEKEADDEPMVLTLADARVFTVVFDRARGVAVDARQIFSYNNDITDPNWQYNATLRLMTVEPEPEEEP